MALPHELRKSPLVEAIFELRFSPAHRAAGELLPGMLFQAFSDTYSEVGALPVANVPLEIRETDPNLKYQALHRLQGGDRALSTGNRVIAFSSGHAYPGKTRFLREIGTVLAELQKTNLVKSVERFAFRYINLLPADEGTQLRLLNATFEVEGASVSEKGFQLRFEKLDGDFVTIVKIHTGATVTFKDGGSRSGLLVDVDTQNTASADAFWARKDDLLTQGHTALKEIFFSLLTDQTIDGCEPVWGEE